MISTKTTKKIVIVRHGERMDDIFGKNEWFNLCFNSKGEYTRKDLNMPQNVHKRDNVEEYNFDPPLTQIGIFQNTLIGEKLLENNINFSFVICSPALRCIESCQAILKASKNNSLPIAIEPGLYDIMQKEKFMTTKELTEAGFNIKTDYTPLYSIEDLNLRRNESPLNYYNRNCHVINELLKKADKEGINILIAGHIGTLVFPIWMEYRHKIPTMKEMIAISRNVEYCSNITLEPKEEYQKIEDIYEMYKWNIKCNDSLNFKHSKRDHFNFNYVKSFVLNLLK